MKLNELAAAECREMAQQADRLRVASDDRVGGRVWDFGVIQPGGLAAGVWLARICLAGLGNVTIVPAQGQVWDGPSIAVWTDHPVQACMGSQYAGWRISDGDYFAMASGPMRVLAGREPLFDRLAVRDDSTEAVGVLESAQLPPAEVCQRIADECKLPTNRLTLLVAPTSSQAGTVQIVARTVETALHKMLELDVDLTTVSSGYGVAPLPPVAADDLVGIGRTNDAVLYGGQVTLWMRGDDDRLAQVATQLPSSASTDYGAPFVEIFQRYNHDFYKIDPLLFSPACVRIVNLVTGRSFQAGEVRPDVLLRSFASD